MGSQLSAARASGEPQSGQEGGLLTLRRSKKSLCVVFSFPHPRVLHPGQPCGVRGMGAHRRLKAREDLPSDWRSGGPGSVGRTPSAFRCPLATSPDADAAVGRAEKSRLGKAPISGQSTKTRGRWRLGSAGEGKARGGNPVKLFMNLWAHP